jgi:hypothetical protein
VVEYKAIRQLIVMKCNNCHIEESIDAANQQEFLKVADWLKVQKSDGETYAYCGVECLQKGAHNLKAKPDHGLEIVGD